jgi:hypothetical protein
VKVTLGHYIKNPLKRIKIDDTLDNIRVIRENVSHLTKYPIFMEHNHPLVPLDS